MKNRGNSQWPTTTIKASSYLRGRIGWQGLRASEFTDHGPYLVTGTDFHDGRIDWSKCYHVSEHRFREAAYIQLRDGDILITKDGTIGKIAFVTDCPQKAILNSGIFLLRCSDGSYDHKFLYQLLNSHIFESFLRVQLAGSTINHLYQYVFETFRFPIPKYKFQERIAEILSTVDEAIEQTEALIAKTQQIKAGLMQDLFTRGVTPDGKLRPPREEAPDLYKKEEPFGWIPKEWGTKTIDELQDSLIDGPFGSNLKSEHYVDEGGVQVVRLQNIQEGEYNDADKVFVSQSHSAFLVRHQVLPGDVLIAALGEDRYPVGRACCYPGHLPPAINKADCFRLRCLPSVADNSYVMGFLNTNAARLQVRRFEQGVTRMRINLGNMKKIIVALPEPDEQKRIVRDLEGNRRSLDSLMDHREKMEQLKSGLMNDLLTGLVPVPSKEINS